MKKSTVKRIQQENTRAVAESATIYSIDMDRVSIRIGSSPNVIKNVEVLGDTEALLPGAEVRIVWIDRRPVVVNGGGGGVSGVGTSGMASLPVHGHTDTDNGGALGNYITYVDHDDPSMHPAYLRILDHASTSLHTIGAVVPHDEHGMTLGLGDDDHMQYVHKDVARTITAKHAFTPSIADAPFTLGANAQHQLVTGLRADELGRQVTAGSGLTGGGSLVSDVTLSVDEAATHTWTGPTTFTRTMVARGIQPASSDAYDLGAIDKLWKKAYISEMDSVSFMNTGATLVGGYLIIPKRSGSLYTAITSGTSVNFDQAMSLNEIVVFRSEGKYEEMLVGALVSGTTYTTTRGYRSSGVDSWAAGTPFAVIGTAGEGYIQMIAADGKPRISLMLRGATDYEIFRVGNMEGAYGLATGDIGLGLGEYASGKPNLTWDPTNGLRLRTFNQDKIRFAPDGNAYIDGFLNIGTAGGIYQGTYQAGHSNDPAYPIKGIKLWNDAGIGRIGGYGDPNGDGVGSLEWYGDTDGKLKAGGGNVVLDAYGMSMRVQAPPTPSTTALMWNYNNQTIGSIDGSVNGASVTQMALSLKNYDTNELEENSVNLNSNYSTGDYGVTITGGIQVSQAILAVVGAVSAANTHIDLTARKVNLAATEVNFNGSAYATVDLTFTDQSSAPVNPASGKTRTYTKNGVPFIKNSAGDIHAMVETFELLKAIPMGSIWQGSISNSTGPQIADRSGAGNHLLRQGAGSLWNWSVSMGNNHLVPYVSLNGTNQWFYRTGANYLQPNGGNYQAMGGWFKFDAVNRYHNLFLFGATTSNIAFYVNNANGLELRWWNTSGTAYTIGAGVGLTTGWHFIAGYIVWSSSSSQVMKIMYDGTWYTSTSPVSPTTLRAAVGDFRIGNDGGNYLYGGFSIAFTGDFTNFEAITNEYYRLTKPQYQ